MSIENIYQYVYLIAATIILLSVLRKQQLPIDEEDDNSRLSYLCLFTVTILTFVIGNRPDQVGSDTSQYMGHYVYIKDTPFEFKWDTQNFIFDNLFAYIGSLGLDIHVFFLIIATIYFGGIYVACRKLFPNNQEIAFFSYLVAFSTFSYATDGVKSGAAASMFLVAVAYRENKKLSALFLIISLGLHHSMIAPIAVYVIALVIKEPKYYYYLWIGCLIMAALHITIFQEFFSNLTNEHGAEYLNITGRKRPISGFRPDFILYSAIPVFMGYYIMNRCNEDNEEFNFIWNLYTGTNAIFLLCTYGAYINRIAYLSWLLYPIVLIYPFLYLNWNDYQHRYLQYAVYGHLAFTLFMAFVYYSS